MPDRTAFLISCSEEEAAMIRNMAKSERRPVSNYMLNIVMRALAVEEEIRIANRVTKLPRSRATISVRSPGPRTGILLRCSIVEAKQIRAAAEQKQMTISGFVLHCLRRSWNIKAAALLQVRPVITRYKQS